METGQANAAICNDHAPSLTCNHEAPIVVGAIDCDIPKQRAQNAAQGHYIAVPIQDGREIEKAQNGLGVGGEGDPAYTLDRTGAQAVAVNISNGEPRVSDVVGTLDAARESRGSSQQRFVMQSAFRKSKRAQTVDDDETLVDDGLANTLNGFDTGDTRTTHAVAFGIDAEMNGSEEIIGCMKRGGEVGSQYAVAFNWQNGGGYGNANEGLGITHDGTEPLQRCQTPAVATRMVVRRLTPTECERLQGFPDGWTQIGTAEKPTADSHRYKQLGNAVTVNVAEWIARRAMKALKGNA